MGFVTEPAQLTPTFGMGSKQRHVLDHSLTVLLAINPVPNPFAHFAVSREVSAGDPCVVTVLTELVSPSF
jgi:hypothetical protein